MSYILITIYHEYYAWCIAYNSKYYIIFCSYIMYLYGYIMSFNMVIFCYQRTFRFLWYIYIYIYIITVLSYPMYFFLFSVTDSWQTSLYELFNSIFFNVKLNVCKILFIIRLFTHTTTIGTYLYIFKIENFFILHYYMYKYCVTC